MRIKAQNMAPRKTRSATKSSVNAKDAGEKTPKSTTKAKAKVTSKYFKDGDEGATDEDRTTNGKKRKRAEPTPKPKKQRKVKEEEKPEKEEPKPDPTMFQTLKYLLSPEALDLCRPNDESKELASKPQDKDYRTYSGTAFTPFEELLSAVILSRPISHSLGHRSIRTILNSPYNFNTPKAIRKAGQKKAHQSMFDARTQHKEKTAIGIVKLADVVAEKLADEDDTTLEKVRKQCKYDVGKEGELLKSSIHGMGNTSLNIFFRRVQWLWPERFPFMDERTESAAAALGLPDDAEELYDSVDAMWEELDSSQFEGKDEDEKKRRAFVVLLERIIGAHLEKKVNKVLLKAEKIPDDPPEDSD